LDESGILVDRAKRVYSTRGLTGPTPLFTFVFDDGHDTDYLVARDIFAAQGAIACSAITTDWINRPGYMSAGQIIGLRDAGWEIMSHTATHPNLSSLTPGQIDDELSRSKTALEGLGVTVRNLVYPFNRNNATVRELAGEYYRSGRGGTNKSNTGVINPHELRSFSNKQDLRKMKGHVDRAHAEKSWLIIYHHEIDARITLMNKKGAFARGEPLAFSPSGARGRHVRDLWFLTAGSLHFVPLTGTPRPGDTILGQTSGATAQLSHVVFNERENIGELVRYILTRYPDMRIVTIDQGLDILGIAHQTPLAENVTVKTAH
jgi:peptidoglycan/xylan/chitin deacetylase (PgdA/CDA1 family)